MKNTKPELITHLILDDGADGYHRYHVRVPVRIAEEIGCEVHRGRTTGIDTLQQFLDAIERRGEYAEFEVTASMGPSCEPGKR
jgi:hypothetical protein